MKGSSKHRRPAGDPALPPAFQERLHLFLNLKTDAQVLKAFSQSGLVMMWTSESWNPAEMTSEARQEFKRSWDLKTDDEVEEALTMAGLITVALSDLVEAARNARHPLTVAKAIGSAIHLLEAQLRGVVPILRARECSWTQIGAALGMTKQSAWERFSGED